MATHELCRIPQLKRCKGYAYRTQGSLTIFCSFPSWVQFPIVELHTTLTSPKELWVSIKYKVLLVGPWPWAPHQKTNTILFNSLQCIQGSIQGMLHSFPLKITPSLVVLFFQPILFFCSVVLSWFHLSILIVCFVFVVMILHLNIIRMNVY